jgi:type IV pilus assembly protein PilC
MPTYEYASRDGRGLLVKGRIEADDDIGARAQLRERGVFVIRLQPESTQARRGIGLPRAAEIALITNHLAMLVGAGLPLLQALETLAEQTEDPQMRGIVEGLARDIQEGKRLSEALERRPDLFPPVYIGLIRNGELSGRLDEALERLAAYLERDQEFRRKVRDAVAYPALVMSLAAVVLAIFLTYVIPAFNRVYQSAGARLPAPTQALVAASALFWHSLPVVGLVVAALLVPTVRRAAWSAVAPPLWRFVLQIPPVRALVQTVALSRFVSALAMMLQSGVPMLSALETAGEAVGASEFRATVRTLTGQISAGRRFGDALRQTGQFPPMIIRMVALGEESGRLDTMLQRAGTVMDKEFELGVRRFLTFLEPALTLMLGGLIGLVLLSLYLPIFGLSRTLIR